MRQFAQHAGDARLAPIVAALTAPMRVAVCGRPGVGRATLARSLAGRWRVVGADPQGGADLAVVVFAEVVKPEDAAALARWRAGQVPALLVRNKADLGGVSAGVPCVALLAEVAVDGETVAALRVLAEEPADLRSTDAFVDAAHRLPREVRLRLLRALDRHGVALSVRALCHGEDPAGLPALLHQASGIDAVHGGLDALSAAARYRRVQAAVAALRAVALRGDPGRGQAIAEFLAGDDAVLGAMTAAVDVLQAAGLAVDPGDTEAAHLRRAVRWRTYSRGPVTPLHRACGADVCRGSLRLLRGAR